MRSNRLGCLVFLIVFSCAAGLAAQAAEPKKDSSTKKDALGDIELPPAPMEPEPPSPYDEAHPKEQPAKEESLKEETRKEAPPVESAPPARSEPENAPESAPPRKEAQPEEAPLTLPSTKNEESPSNDTANDASLMSPTRSVEEYEKARRRHLFRSTLPDSGLTFTLAPAAFKRADLRAPTRGGFDQNNPGLFGILPGYDRVLYRQNGIVMAGLDGGVYTSTAKDPYTGLAFGFLSLTPHLQYEASFFYRQWVVPTISLGLEFLRYSYTFQNNPVRGFRTMPRIDLGFLFDLNILEPSSGGQMQANYGIKRTYLSAYYTLANDSNKQDFDLTESTFRVGFRFEL